MFDDGTWRKRGFSSLQGAVTCISAKTGQCFDNETLNKVCYKCALKKKGGWLIILVNINYSGSASAMEREGVKRI